MKRKLFLAAALVVVLACTSGGRVAPVEPVTPVEPTPVVDPIPLTEDNKEAVHDMAAARKIPLVQLAYKTPTKNVRFETAQFDYVKENSECTTVFQAASVSKTVFAYIVMRMVDRNEIDLDTPLYKYTDIDRFVDKDAAKKLTARMVLTHTTGLPNWMKVPSGGKWETTPIEFKYPPGTYNYSGEGIAFLQRAVEKIRGKKLQEIAKEEVFDPLGMPNTSYVWLPQYATLSASGYNKDNENVGVGRNMREDAAFTMRTNVVDFSKFLDAMLVGKGLSEKSFKLMLEPIIPVPKKKPEDVQQYRSIGMVVVKNDVLGNCWGHTGSNGTGWRCGFIVVPKQQSYLVYFTNSYYGAGDFRTELYQLFYGPDMKY